MTGVDALNDHQTREPGDDESARDRHPAKSLAKRNAPLRKKPYG
jgi:hypothetical protein